MLRAAPDYLFRGGGCRTQMVNQREPVEVEHRYTLWYYHHSRVDTNIYPDVSGSLSQFEIPSLSSGSWVEPGRVGEVESLVGDFRPPPPGNPRRPSHDSRRKVMITAGPENLPEYARFVQLMQKWQKNGGVFLPQIRLHTFNRVQNPSNLKILSEVQYFKNPHSFFYCRVSGVMLRFDHSHCHRYGFRQVGAPSIAITYVLRT